MIIDNKDDGFTLKKRLGALILVTLFLAVCLSSCKPHLGNIDPSTVRGPVSPLNCTSCESDLYLCDDALFAFVSDTLYEIESSGSFRKIFYTSNASTGFFLGNGFFYYMKDETSDQEDYLHTWIIKRYDLKTRKTETVASKIEKAEYFLSRGDTMYLITSYKDYVSITEKDNKVEVLVKGERFSEELTVGKSTLLVEYDCMSYNTTLSKLTNDGSKETILKTGPCAVIQISDDRLLVSRISPDRVHISPIKSLALAWIVDSAGDLHELMCPEGYAYFTGNYCNGYYYCSFYRYKELHTLLHEKYKNDKLEGTWKVNVETFEKTKISGKIYNDIFVIGDKVIGADSCSLFDSFRTFWLIANG